MDLFEFCSDHAREIDVITDGRALFLLTFIAELRNTSRQVLLAHLGWSGEFFDGLWDKLRTAGLVRDESAFGRENPLRLSMNGRAFITALRFPLSAKAAPKSDVSLLGEIASISAVAHAPFIMGTAALSAASIGAVLRDVLAREHPSERLLLMRARAGDAAAYEELFRIFRPVLYRLCLAFLQNRQDAEDAVQQTFLEFISLPHALDERPIGPLLRTIAKRRSFDIFRRRYPRQTSLDARPHEEEESLPSWLGDEEWMFLRRGPSIEPRTEATQEVDAILAEALAALPHIERTIIAMRMAGMTYPEVAKIMDISPERAARMYYRAKEHLQRALGAKKAVGTNAERRRRGRADNKS